MTNRTRTRIAALLATTALCVAPVLASDGSSRPVFEVTVSEPEATAPKVAAPKVAAPEAAAPDAASSDAIAFEIDPLATGTVGAASAPVEARYGIAAEPPVDVRATFDGLEAKPVLNVDTDRDAATAPRDEPLGFRGYWNYGRFIHRAEVRVLERGDSPNADPLAVVPLDRDGLGEWVPPSHLPDDLAFTLRVYDREGRFDETERTALTLLDEPALPPKGQDAFDGGLDAYGIDRTARRGIPVRGGLVTVTGVNVLEGESVLLNGRAVPVDGDGAFVAQEIVPHGVSTVLVAIDGPRPRLIERDVEVPKTDVFYVALGEATLGRNIRSGDALRRASGEPDEVELRGRGAVYLKGRVRGDVLITAAADTREGEMGDLFRGLRSREARDLVALIDPDRFYPVYGDDSTFTQDAASRSGLFVRIERDDNLLQYGTYSVAFEEAELARLDRGLEGLVAQHRSLAQTSFGERKRELTVYAARNETLPAYETFLGTGGTIYLLGRQDLVVGSERLSVEVRDRTSGLVTSTLVLEPGRDYTIDPIAGRVRLSKPLRARLATGRTVREGSLTGDDVYLTARYEYVPTDDDLEGYNLGARGQMWLGEHLRVGATAQGEATETERRQLFGADVVLRHSAGTYVKGEIARSEGPGFASAASLDGGFSFARSGARGGVDGAQAYRVEGALDLGNVLRGARSDEDGGKGNEGGKGIDGSLTGYLEHFERGFTGQRFDVEEDTTRYGAALRLQPSKRVGLSAALDVIDTNVTRRLSATADVKVKATERIDVSVGVRHDRIDRGLTPADSLLLPTDDTVGVLGTSALLDAELRSGSRTDAAVELSYEGGEDWTVYAFGQGTIALSDDRERNDRGGVGGEYRINDRFTVGGEVSGGTTGLGGDLRLLYQGDDDVTVELGYGYAGDLRADEAFLSRSHSHALNARATKRYSDHFSVFSEGRLGFSDYALGRDLTQAYGVELAPSERWAVTALVERGELFELDGIDQRRTSGSATVSYRGDKLRASGTLEARFDERDRADNADLGNRALAFKDDGHVLAARGAVSWRHDDTWTLHGTAEWVEAEGEQTAVADSDYTKLVAAAAYRPVEHDRVNALFKYIYLSDLSPLGQLTSTGVAAQPKQKSHVLSADAVVDVAPWLTVGAKYALRRGEVGIDRRSELLIEQMAQLAILRADFHVLENWDVMAEARVLDVEDVDTLLGGVIGVWRQVGKVRVGAGYSFSSFSDDITDLTHDDEGWFVNVAAAL